MWTNTFSLFAQASISWIFVTCKQILPVNSWPRTHAYYKVLRMVSPLLHSRHMRNINLSLKKIKWQNKYDLSSLRFFPSAGKIISASFSFPPPEEKLEKLWQSLFPQIPFSLPLTPIPSPSPPKPLERLCQSYSRPPNSWIHWFSILILLEFSATFVAKDLAFLLGHSPFDHWTMYPLGFPYISLIVPPSLL